ncbi:phage tail sheath protein [Deltaproteobacteria bacterium Smac51]|nr:phage tail sheath protein [Deltaproteobacteria bacterium Smac51]
MAYRHGVYAQEQGTSIVPPVRVDSSLPVVVGTAPVHMLDSKAMRDSINKPHLLFSQSEIVKTFGSLPDGAKVGDYTLSEFANIYMGRYLACPVVFINVFDPEKHKNDKGEPDVTKVSPDDIIGGIDSVTGGRTGLELVEEVFPRFGITPGQLVAPKFSGDPAVALILGAKTVNINGHFNCVGIVDVPESVRHFTEVSAWVNDNNLVDRNLIFFFGQPTYGNVPESGSSHVAGVMAQRDMENEGIPYWSPSNKRLLANGIVHGGNELHLTPVEAAYLNGQGIMVGLSWVGGLVAWGNRTGAYPGATDVKDTFIPLRRMFHFISNTLVLTAWQFLDGPLRRRHITTICDSFNIWLNGLSAREFILGGRVEFLNADNAATDLMDGISRFRVYIAPPSPNREMIFDLEYDPAYLSRLFGLQE